MMKTFDEIYQELKTEDMQEINKLYECVKKKSKNQKRIALIICAIVDILILFLVSANLKSVFFSMFAIMFIFIIDTVIYVIITLISGFSKEYKELNTQYKNIVIKKIINNFYDNLEYFPYKSMPEYIYENAGYEYYDCYSSDDYFEAQINNKYSIQMAEVLTKEKREHEDANGEKREEKIVKFKGLFTKIILDKNINSELRIMQNGKFLLDKNKLNMDSSEFEKYFDVKTTNKIIAMQLLTSDVMEELIKFEDKTKMKYDIYIKNDELYLRFHSGAMFEIENLKKEILDKELIQKYFYMLNFTYNLSNKLINIISDTQI